MGPTMFQQYFLFSFAVPRILRSPFFLYAEQCLFLVPNIMADAQTGLMLCDISRVKWEARIFQANAPIKSPYIFHSQNMYVYIKFSFYRALRVCLDEEKAICFNEWNNMHNF